MLNMNYATENRVLPATLRPDDARIPAGIRERFGDYDRTIATASPVLLIGGIEWLLYDTENKLVDTLYDGIRNKGSY